MKKHFQWPAVFITLMAGIAAAQQAAALVETGVETIRTGGRLREFIVHAPADVPDRAPLVFVLHGAWNNGANFRKETGFDRIADESGFVVVYPYAVDRTLGKDWDVSGMEDVDFLLTLVAEMKNRFRIDSTRIYATGFSMGGYICHHLACNASNVFAAVTPVAGHCRNLKNEPKPCHAVRPVPILMIHGTADPVVKYDLLADDVKWWVERNGGCPGKAVLTDPYPASNSNSNVTREVYGPCNQGAEVAVMSVKGLAHNYPGGNGAEDASINAAKEAWAFLKRFSLDGIARPASKGGKTIAAVQRRRVEIKDGWYFIDGRKFFLNAIGYEIGARPGQHPYQNRVPEPARVERDLQVIKRAGFNAVRTWAELFEPELRVLQRSGLKVVLGIWVKPDVDFSNHKVAAVELANVKRVLAYSKNYDCIITYLIMNEPMPQHIRKVGSQATADLWKKIIDLIHREHPGVPVTISGNAAITEFVDMNLFDVYAYNLYDYDGDNSTIGYTNTLRLLKERNAQGKPLILTEFGLSVSRQGWGRYGGNTLAQQAAAIPRYYRDLLDAGAVGACPFYYADGWWKGGEPAKHNDTPEEWFGYWGYRDLSDTVGTPRPAWHAVTQYNTALVTSPKNQTYYRNEIPLEAFLQDNVAGMRVIYQDRIVYSRDTISSNHFVGSLLFPGENLTDRELIFEFYDRNGSLLKLESVIVLTGESEIRWPSVSVTTGMKDLDEGKTVRIELSVRNGDVFTLGDRVRYIFAPHIGWNPGEKRQWMIDPAKREQMFQDSFSIPDESPLLGLSAGVDIRYGKFVKTIYDSKIIYRGNWADPIRIK